MMIEIKLGRVKPVDIKQVSLFRGSITLREEVIDFTYLAVAII